MTAGRAEAPAREGDSREHGYQTRRCHADASAALETQEGRTAATAVIARGGQSGEVGLCRYCGSNDLAPSFKKRRDARCRACFKKRYGSAARKKRSTRTRKTKAAK